MGIDRNRFYRGNLKEMTGEEVKRGHRFFKEDPWE